MYLQLVKITIDDMDIIIKANDDFNKNIYLEKYKKNLPINNILNEKLSSIKSTVPEKQQHK